MDIVHPPAPKKRRRETERREPKKIVEIEVDIIPHTHTFEQVFGLGRFRGLYELRPEYPSTSGLASFGPAQDG